jgi:hypothetical protein
MFSPQCMVMYLPTDQEGNGKMMLWYILSQPYGIYRDYCQSDIQWHSTVGSNFFGFKICIFCIEAVGAIR